MVRSIRTWCLATQMLVEKPFVGTSRLRPLASTEVAEAVFAEAGDPYIEDLGTLWLLHWLLVTNPDRLSLWRIAFMFSKENEFSKPDLFSLVSGHAGDQQVEPTVVSRDADVFVRCYAGGRATFSEEDFSCPLQELGLIVQGGPDRYCFVVGAKRTLPSPIFGFAMIQFLRMQEASECSLSDATYLPGSPGQAFKLDEDSVVAHLRDLQGTSITDWIVDVDGPIRRIGIKKPLSELRLLTDYYRSLGE